MLSSVGETEEDKSYGYGKRPLWQWVILYVLIGGIIYAAVYYFFLAKKGGYNYNQAGQYQTQPTTQPLITPTQNQTTTGNEVIRMKNDPNIGQYLTDTNGMTLYTYEADKPGVSNCSGSCLANWPPYLNKNNVTSFPADVGTIKRADGSMQFTYKGMPLYYFINDTQPGQITGDGVGKFHVAR